MLKKRVYLYAFNKLCKIEGFYYFEGDNISIWNIREQALWMLNRLGSTSIVYAVDNRPGLYFDYLEAVKSNSFEKHVMFEDLISREGILVAKR